MQALFENGQTILFVGDSVTDCGRAYADDSSLGEVYPTMIAKGYTALFGAGVNFVNRGVSGNRVRDVLARYQRDILAVKPDFLSILIGINDVWRRYDSNDATSAADFEADYRRLLTLIKRDLPHTKIMLIEPFVLHSLPDRVQWHVDLDPKIQVVRQLAAEFADYYVPMDGLFAAAACKHGCKALAEDGVHPSPLGHRILAQEYMQTLAAQKG